MEQPSRDRHERGGVIIFVVLVLVPLLGCIALAVDGFIIMTGKIQQERIVESAALSGLEHYMTTQNSELAVQRAEQTVLANSMVAMQGKELVEEGKMISGEQGRIELGEFEVNTLHFTPRIGGPFNALRVELTNDGGRSIVALFAGVLGFKSFTLRSAAIAYYDGTMAASGKNPYTVVYEREETL